MLWLRVPTASEPIIPTQMIDFDVFVGIVTKNKQDREDTIEYTWRCSPA